MPGGDGTGPAGLGPMTGRSAGFCAGYPAPGYANPVGGRGYFGWGRGGGRGRRNWYHATGLPGWARTAQGIPAWGGGVGSYMPSFGPAQGASAIEQEQDLLKRQAEFLQNSIDAVNKRIEELEKAE